MADMLEIAVLTEDGRRYVRPTREKLAGLIGAIGGENNRFLVVQPIPDLPDTFIQVWHRAGNETYLLEHRAGAPDRHFQVALDGPEPVIAAMTGWAVAQDGWDTGLNWTALNLGPVEPIPPLPLDEDQREELEARVRKAILGGYATRAELARIAHDHLTLEEDLPGLIAMHDRVAKLPGIAAYLASERRIAFNTDGIFRHYPELDGA